MALVGLYRISVAFLETCIRRRQPVAVARLSFALALERVLPCRHNCGTGRPGRDAGHKSPADDISPGPSGRPLWNPYGQTRGSARRRCHSGLQVECLFLGDDLLVDG